METINTPYIKKYDENGKVLPLEGGKYLHTSPNRKSRRAILNNKSFTGNHKGHKLTVSGVHKYKRVVQVTYDQVKKVFKKINHFIPA